MKTSAFFRRSFLSALIIFSFIYVKAQKEGNIWTFPDRINLNFNDTSNILVDTSSDGGSGGFFPLINNSTIADSAGNLFCYSTGLNLGFTATHVYDRTHHLMPNGNNLQGNGIFASLLLPYPGIDSLIYLFHIGRDQFNTSNFMLFYSLINKNLNGGFGDVVLRDSMILYGTLSWLKLASCKHGNGRDYWLFVKDYNADIYHYFLLTPEGITNLGVQNVGFNDHRGYGKLLFSNDGTRMMNVSDSGSVSVFDFDRCTGILSNFLDIGEHTQTEATGYYSAAFSPNGNLIYVSPFYFTKVFYQWNLNAGTLTDIQNSKTLLNEYPDTGIVANNTYFWHNLAPDGKIYIPIMNNYLSGSNGNTYVTQHLDVIEYPDSVGLACHYVKQGFSLNSKRVCGALPNMPYYGLKEDSGSVCDSLPPVGIIEVNGSESGIEVFPNPFYNKVSFHLLQTSSEKILIKILNELGEVVFEKETHLKDQEVDLNELSKGIYFLNVMSEKISVTKKIVKM